MEPLVALSCADDSRRTAIVDALVRGGLELTDTFDELATIHVLDDAHGVLIRNHEDTLIQVSMLASPDDITSLARLGIELTMLWGIARSYEDCEASGVIAAHVAHDALSALVPVMFAADALARDYPGARVLTSLLVESSKRAACILQRITPVERASPTIAMCVNAVIGELAATMRAIASRSTLVTRLESPLAGVMIERPDLERILLTLIANAAEATRNSQRIVVATSLRATSPRIGEPPCDWVCVEVEDDGANVEPSVSTSIGLPSVARAARSAGGHVSIDTKRRGTTIALWLPAVK
jgi:signal transduction histidine kinase